MPVASSRFLILDVGFSHVVIVEVYGKSLQVGQLGIIGSQIIGYAVTFSPACGGGGFLLKNPNEFSIDRLSPYALWFARFYESCRSISLLPSSRMFFAAFTSRSCQAPQDGHAHSRTDRSLTCGFR